MGFPLIEIHYAVHRELSFVGTHIVVTSVTVVEDMLGLLTLRCRSHIPDSQSLMISPRSKMYNVIEF